MKSSFKTLCFYLVTVVMVVSGISCNGDSIPTSPTSNNVENPSSNTPSPLSPLPPPPQLPVTLIGAGDIAYSSSMVAAEATAKLIESMSGTVFTAGDNVQGDGSEKEFNEYFNPTWGRFKNRILIPAPGNHEYVSPGARPYFNYFGNIAGVARGYYSVDLGEWKIYSLNSEIGVTPSSAQYAWLENELQGSTSKCSMAIWHQALFSSGPTHGAGFMREIAGLLYKYGVDVLVSGHDHIYERFALQDNYGRRDDVKGFRQFIVGTGGMYLFDIGAVQPNSEIRFRAHGIIRFTLYSAKYEWQFMPIPGSIDSDFGSDSCR